MRKLLVLTFFLVILSPICFTLSAQELRAKVTVTHDKVQGTNDDFFQNLQKKIDEFLNKHRWTDWQYKSFERIILNLNINVNEYDADTHHLKTTCSVQSLRPVLNSTYKTILFAFEDPHFDFIYDEYAPLEFRLDQIDNSLTALLAYYSYFIIGIDNDAMSPNGGNECLNNAKIVAQSGPQLQEKGWEQFGDEKSRYSLIDNYLDPKMSDFRQLQYSYYRKGLDQMSINVDRGRTQILTALLKLKSSYENNTISYLPILFTDYKANELVGIFEDKGSIEDRKEVYDILNQINPSRNYEWRKIQK